MKQSPQDRLQQERLLASRFSAAGFMGHDQRGLEQVIASDRTLLQKLAVDAASLARRLGSIDDRARSSLGMPVEIAPGITARHYEAMGRIPSPFPGDGVFPKGETRIEWSDGRCLRVTRLGLALIEKYGFFQGQGSPYRIDPELASVLPPCSPEPDSPTGQ